MIDTHTHLNFEVFKDDWQKVVVRAVKAGIERMIVVGTDLESSERAVKMAKENKWLWAAVGVHPHHARALLEDSRSKIQDLRRLLEKLAKHKKVVAIGEIGLDYHIYRNSKRYQMEQSEAGWKRLKNLQKQLLGMQVQLSKALDKPMIIHSREAGEEVLDVIEHFSKSEGKYPRGVFHCFDGGKRYLKKILEAGFWVSFTGKLTYAEDRARVAKAVPLKSLLLETDCPYMKPKAFHLGGGNEGEKRTRSEPKDVKIVASFHARERGISVSKVACQTTENAERLFFNH